MSAPAPRRARAAADPREAMAVAAGGVAGALARAGLAEALPAGAGRWPWATFAANLLGALLLGYAVTRLQERLPPSAWARPLVGTGLCGALTTFSTMQVEVLRMLDHGVAALAAAYVAASLAAGFAAVLAGSGVARRASLAR